MAAERLAPDALVEQTNLSGAVTAIDDDPDSPDGSWLTAPGSNNNTVARVTFPTPTGAPTVGVGLQNFRVQVRKTNHSTNPTCALQLYENGSLVAEVLGATAVSSTSGVVLAASWNASSLGTADGSLVECRVVGAVGGGNPSNRASLEVGAVEWNVDYTVGVTPTRGRVSFSEVETPIGATRGRISVAAVEAPLTTTRGRISVAVVEFPFVATRGRISVGAFEAPIAQTRGRVSVTELAVPSAPATPTRGRISVTQMDVPFAGTRGRISVTALELPLAPTRGRMSFAALEGPLGATRGRVAYAAMDVPPIPTRGLASWAELETPSVSGGARSQWRQTTRHRGRGRGR